MRVVPECPDLGGPEAIRVAPAWSHGILRHAGDAVFAVADVDPVPVHRDAAGDVPVPECHFDKVAFSHAQLRARGRCR